jgi:hypothetical protein
MAGAGSPAQSPELAGPHKANYTRHFLTPRVPPGTVTTPPVLNLYIKLCFLTNRLSCLAVTRPR